MEEFSTNAMQRNRWFDARLSRSNQLYIQVGLVGEKHNRQGRLQHFQISPMTRYYHNIEDHLDQV